LSTSQEPPPQYKECPYCSETILAKARKCKHCGEMLDDAGAAPPSARREASPNEDLPTVEELTSRPPPTSPQPAYQAPPYSGADRWPTSVARQVHGFFGEHEISPISRTVYILLGVFLGGLGIHNFVAERTAIAACQLAIFVVSFPLLCLGIGFLTIWVPSVWAIVDIVAVQHDGQGRLMV
jgi:TM2 domain-containing membrane protein YozV